MPDGGIAGYTPLLFGMTRLGIFLLAILPAAGLSQQQSPLPRDTTIASPVPPSPESPRASLQRYLELARAGDFNGAGSYLDAPDSSSQARARMARELKAVLDRHLWFELEEISSLATGDTADGLAPGVEQVGSIPSINGPPQPVRLVKGVVNAEPGWRFSSGTVSRIPGWYAALGDRWIIEHLPAALLRPGPLELLWWQWLALPIVLALAFPLGWIASRMLRAMLRRAARGTAGSWDDTAIERVGGPLTGACTLAACAIALSMLRLYPPAEAVGFRILRAGGLLVFFWALLRLVDIGRLIISRTTWARTAAGSRALLPLGARVAKVLVIAMAAVATLSLLGYPVASLIAGLGLGGLALALAAQKTVENLFGAFSIGIDQPYREGDFVKIEDFVGTVESIGLRSTRFRTLDRTIITIPNGRLAEMRLESFTARDRLRFAAVVGLVYETTAEQMRAALAGFEGVLRAHPKIWPDAVVVRFSGLGASSLDIEIMAWFLTADWGEFQGIREDILLSFMDVVERVGTSFAFPTQTLHVATMPSPTGLLDPTPALKGG